jgi:hypothetical protein
VHGVQSGFDDTIARLAKKIHSTREGRYDAAAETYMLHHEDKHARISELLWCASIGLITIGMRALQLKPSLAHRVMSDKKHELRCDLHLSLCLC